MNEEIGLTDENANEQETTRVNCQRETPGYKRVAWSRSMSEEVIGALWCIVAVLAYTANIRWLMWVAGIKAGSDQLISLYFAIKEIGALKREIAKRKSL